MFTKETFCKIILNLPYSKVSQSISKDLYKQFNIPKKNGVRTIKHLDKRTDLWKIQQKLLVNFLQKQNLPVCVKGFKQGESYYSFLSEHIGSKYFLRIDIFSFFASITVSQIKSELSRVLQCASIQDRESILNLICDITTLDDSLPQGACTSPMVSNLVMARIDQRITKYCQVFDIKYTRYADDLLFSSTNFDFKKRGSFLKKIKHILFSQKLRLNYSKIKFGQSHISLNGYVVSCEGVRLSRKRLSDIRRVISFVKSNDSLTGNFKSVEFLQKVNKLPFRHRNMSEYPFKTLFQFLQYLCGYRAFLISFVDRNYAETSFQKQLQHLIRKIESTITAIYRKTYFI